MTCIQEENQTENKNIDTHRIGRPENLNVPTQISEENVCKPLLNSKRVLNSLMNLYEKKASEVDAFFSHIH